MCVYIYVYVYICIYIYIYEYIIYIYCPYVRTRKNSIHYRIGGQNAGSRKQLQLYSYTLLI